MHKYIKLNVLTEVFLLLINFPSISPADPWSRALRNAEKNQRWSGVAGQRQVRCEFCNSSRKPPGSLSCGLKLGSSLTSTPLSCRDHLPLEVTVFHIYVKLLHTRVNRGVTYITVVSQNMNVFHSVRCNVGYYSSSTSTNLCSGYATL